MPTGLRRYQSAGHLYFLSINCFRKRPIFDTAEPHDTFLRILEETRQKYRFEVHGYVIMPTHVHLLLSEPPATPLATAVQVIKQRFSRTRIESEVWEARYYDFNVFTRAKRIEKIQYMHQNPVEAGIVLSAEDWPWSSASDIVGLRKGPVDVVPFS